MTAPLVYLAAGRGGSEEECGRGRIAGALGEGGSEEERALGGRARLESSLAKGLGAYRAEASSARRKKAGRYA